MDSGFKITGIIEVIAGLDKAVADIRREVANALYEEALDVLEEAKRRVPVKFGKLRDSGQVFKPIDENGTIIVRISFGDETVDYAISVHEKLNVRHVSGRSKYLESVMLEYAGGILQRIAARVKI